MWVELPAAWIAVLNVVAVPAIHLGMSWLFTGMPAGWFRPGGVIFRERRWERGGRTHERLFAVRAWKDRVPDAAPWFRGFAKKNLRGRDPEYIRAFRVETCRGEAAHYAQIAGLLATLVWNPWPVAAGVMIAYAFLSNLPCIVLQRHTRHRLGHLLAGILRKTPHSGRG